MPAVVLLEPEIPQNTGNVARTCACLGCELHLVEPMGFRLSSKQLSRAGCDYWDDVAIVRHACAEAFFDYAADTPFLLFTGHAERSFYDVDIPTAPSAAAAAASEGASLSGTDGAAAGECAGSVPPCYFVFGRESRGIDPAILSRSPEACVRLPMAEGARSLNLSNAVAVALFEAARRLGFAGLV